MSNNKCHSRESGNPERGQEPWIPNQVGNDNETMQKGFSPIFDKILSTFRFIEQ